MTRRAVPLILLALITLTVEGRLVRPAFHAEGRAPTVEAQSEPPRPLRFVTFNLLHGGPSSGWTGSGQELEARLAMAVAELRELDADVVALQEASVTRGHGNVAERIARQLGFHYVHGPATERVFPFRLLGRLIVTAINFNEGPAIVSRFPIAASEVYDLPRCVKYLDPRVLLRAEVSTPSGPLQVFSTHTSRGADCQTTRIGEIVGTFKRSGPAIVMGDFNSSERSPAIEKLVAETGFVDAFRTTNPDAPGLTVWQRIDAPGPTVFRRVDYLFLAVPDGVAGTVVGSRLVLNTPRHLPDGRLLWPSDHYGVLGDLALRPGFARRIAVD